MPDLSQIAQVIARHLPPSADHVRVRPLDTPARAWATALTTEHFVRLCEEGECDAALAADLALVSQVGLRPGGRAIVLLSGETRSLSDLAAILSEAGFARILIEPVLDGAFVLARGEPRSDVADRSAEIAAPGVDLTVARSVQPLPRYLHLLVHQEPPSRGWEQPDPASITWDAVAVRKKATGESMLLGFSSLVKAVAFMKPAVLAGTIPNINKMPRYRGETVAGWGAPVMLNPAFEVLREDNRYDFGSPPLRVDPRLEDKVRE
ncbi:MAG: hypothetical protein ACRDGG_00815 [Anaerolineae bacterium]